MTVPEPIHDDLFGDVPEAYDPRPYNQLVADLMEAWDTSKPETERRMENYTLAQCEYLVLERWGAV